MQKEIEAYISEHKDMMMELWENIVSIESCSSDKEGVDRLAAHLDTYLNAMGLKTTKYTFEHAGAGLIAETKYQPEEEGGIVISTILMLVGVAVGIC